MTRNDKYYLWIILFLHSCFSLIYSDYTDYKFEKVASPEGLAQRAGNIFQDRKGFIWLATTEGLARYDGYSCKLFQPRIGDSDRISNNEVGVIYENPADSGKYLWCGTGKGLLKFDQESETFTLYQNIPDDSSSLSRVSLKSLRFRV